MRERRPSDWIVDLTDRHGLEGQVRDALDVHQSFALLQSSTNSFNKLDYQLVGPGGRLCELELKAKRQPLSPGWRRLRPDVDPADLFVLDELALRKIVDAGRYAFLLVRDLPQDRWCLWSAGHLIVASRVRHGRQLTTTTVSTVKGKLVFDLSEADTFKVLSTALDTAAATVRSLETRWTDIAPWPQGGRTG